MTENVLMVPINKVRLPCIPLRSINTRVLKVLMDSIKEHGIMKPIVVEDSRDGYYEVIDGTHRLHCAKELGLIEIPIRIPTKEEYKATLERFLNGRHM